MQTLKYVIFFLLIVSIFSCIKPEKTKTIKWDGNTITLSVLNGGMTSANLYLIEYKRKWIFGKNRLIFWSYSTPSVNDITVENDNLIIHCLARKDQTNTIIIQLNNINEFIGSPIKYRRDVLEKTNDFYVEPNFIKQSRKEAAKHGLL
jgi:hypothetical protein